MKTFAVLMMCAAVAMSACAPTTKSGQPISRAGIMDPADTGKIQLKTLDAVNALRSAKGLQPMQLNAQLNAAAATHSRDMSVQNRPWHFGSDGSSPLDRVQRVGYTGTLLGELISETFQSDLETLSDWMKQPDTRAVIMDPAANEMGFDWFQETNGKVWWTMVTGTSGYAPGLAALPVQQ
jgi:uncharacterized protein YkwD